MLGINVSPVPLQHLCQGMPRSAGQPLCQGEPGEISGEASRLTRFDVQCELGS